MKDVILEYFNLNNHFISKEELKKRLNIKGEEQTQVFFDALEALVEDGSLFFDTKKGYRLFENDLGMAFGEIEINKSGNGFVHTNDGYNIFIESNDLNGALNGDRVIVSSIVFGKGDSYKGEVYKVIKRKTGKVLFEVVGNGYDATLIPYNKNEYVDVFVNRNEFKNLVNGEIVSVKVGCNKIDNQFLGEIEKVVGNVNDPDIDLKMIYESKGVVYEFSEDALREANEMPVSVSDDDLIGRVDLRDLDIVTLDCDDTKDRDDAVYVVKLDNGNYKLYTSIMHISNYIKKGSSLYKEASIRNTSHYPNNTCNPMFPFKVSNGICSLNEGVDRLARTCEMEFDSEGNLVNYDIYKSVIRSRKAMKYGDVNRILAGEHVEGYEKYEEQLRLMAELDNILQRAREDRNYVDFDIPDTKMVRDDDGKISGFVDDGIGKSQRIIENFMLATGTCVAEHYSWLPFIYRIHEAPNEMVVKNVIKLLRLSGFSIPKFNNVDERVLKNIIERLGNSDEAKLVRSILLKSMKRARYDTNNCGHFALQLPRYCHFTSPIRRFTDFRIHTLIDELEEMDYSEQSILNLEKELNDIAKRASESEKIAQEIESEAMAMAMAEYMEGHIGDEFSGVVCEVYQTGMLVKTNNLIIGKVGLWNISGDHYYYDDNKHAIVGRKHKEEYRIGNRVYVICKDACKATRSINFEIKNEQNKSLKRVKY